MFPVAATARDVRFSGLRIILTQPTKHKTKAKEPHGDSITWFGPHFKTQYEAYLRETYLRQNNRAEFVSAVIQELLTNYIPEADEVLLNGRILAKSPAIKALSQELEQASLPAAKTWRTQLADILFKGLDTTQAALPPFLPSDQSLKDFFEGNQARIERLLADGRYVTDKSPAGLQARFFL